MRRPMRSQAAPAHDEVTDAAVPVAADPDAAVPAVAADSDAAVPAPVAEAPVVRAPEGPAPVAAAPDPDALVPLADLAPAIQQASLSRRAFLGFGLAITGALAGAAGLARLFPVFADDSPAAYPIGTAYDPATKQWTFIVDTAACIGCGLCVVACKEENRVPEEAEYTRTWIERHVTTVDGAMFVDAPEGGMHGFPPDSTAPGAAGRAVESSFFEPRLCMQCIDSPCTGVCPVGATYKTPDGVILVDARRCIGCGYCVVACPYGARYLVPDGPDTPGGYAGVADKCTWCYHRISTGGRPACVEICPVGARKFGDAAVDREIQEILASGEAKPLHPEYGTRPAVLYMGPAVSEA